MVAAMDGGAAELAEAAVAASMIPLPPPDDFEECPESNKEPIDAEKHRQMVVDVAKKRVSKSRASGIGTTTIDHTRTDSTNSDTSSDESPTGVGDQQAQQLLVTSPTDEEGLSGIAVEKSFEEVKAKIVMVQEDDDDDDEDPVMVFDNSSDIPWDEDPSELPDDMPSFDAGDSWAGATRAVSPTDPNKISLTVVHVPQPAEQTQQKRSPAEDTANDNKPNNKAAPVSTSHKQHKCTSSSEDMPRVESTSFEESSDDIRASPTRRTKSRLRISTAKATRVHDLLVGPSKSSNSAGDELSRNVDELLVGRRRHYSNSTRRKGGKKQQKQLHAATSGRGRTETDDSFFSDDRTNSFSIAETDIECKGIMGNINNCLVSSSKRSGLILEFDQELFGVFKLPTWSAGDGEFRSRKLDVTYDDDDVSDISSLTGKFRRSKRMVAEQRRAKSPSSIKEETKDTDPPHVHHNPFDWMLMICGDLKALVSEGVGGHGGEEEAKVAAATKTKNGKAAIRKSTLAAARQASF